MSETTAVECKRVNALLAQEEINAILKRSDGERMICDSITQTGSHRSTERCMTVAQRAEQQRENQRALSNHLRSTSLEARS